MGRGELVFLGIMAVLVLVPLARTGEGTTGLIRSAIGDAMDARQEYDAGKGNHAFTLELRGRDKRTYADVSGTSSVTGPYRDAGFIVGTDQGARSVGRSASCKWYAEHASIVRGAPEETTSVEIRAKRATASSLIESLRPLESAGQGYLLGTLVAPGIKPAPPVVTVAGKAATLSYAEPKFLEAWRSRALRELDLSVQVRHPPGAAIPALSPVASGEPPVDPLLRHWVERSQ